MTDEQIMQGLKWCYQVEGSCGDCPYRPDDIKKAKCHDRLGNDVIGLIERQKEEIDRLKAKYDNEHECYLQICEDLKHKLNWNAKARAEAIKTFAEEVKAISRPFPLYEDHTVRSITEKEIDNLVKEMVGAEQ